MKKILCLTLLVLIFLATGISAAKVPDLLGKWTGLESWYGEVNGSAKLTENKSINVTVVEQKNRLFTGNLTYKLENGTEIVEGFAGAIGLDNKTLYLAELIESQNPANCSCLIFVHGQNFAPSTLFVSSSFPPA